MVLGAGEEAATLLVQQQGLVAARALQREETQPVASPQLCRDPQHRSARPRRGTRRCPARCPAPDTRPRETGVRPWPPRRATPPPNLSHRLDRVHRPCAGTAPIPNQPDPHLRAPQHPPRRQAAGGRGRSLPRGAHPTTAGTNSPLSGWEGSARRDPPPDKAPRTALEPGGRPAGTRHQPPARHGVPAGHGTARTGQCRHGAPQGDGLGGRERRPGGRQVALGGPASGEGPGTLCPRRAACEEGNAGVSHPSCHAACAPPPHAPARCRCRHSAGARVTDPSPPTLPASHAHRGRPA